MPQERRWTVGSARREDFDRDATRRSEESARQASCSEPATEHSSHGLANGSGSRGV